MSESVIRTFWLVLSFHPVLHKGGIEMKLNEYISSWLNHIKNELGVIKVKVAWSRAGPPLLTQAQNI